MFDSLLKELILHPRLTLLSVCRTVGRVRQGGGSNCWWRAVNRANDQPESGTEHKHW